ncbi:hypothetical protein BH11GEM1_BH11GEM1_23160 [soil metagenome]
MTLGDWLRARTPRPPAALVARLDAVLGEALDEPEDRATEVFLAAGERLVAGLLSGDRTSRDSALDLLTADALVTYAFEAAGARPGGLDARADDAMARIASLADLEPTSK